MKKGFTLIELLIVISIIGILAVALLPNILSAPATARDAGRKAALNNVLSAMEQYKAANGAYPGTAGTPTTLPTSLNSYFKGRAAPTGAGNNSGAAETPFATLSYATATPSTAVAYCPLTSNTGGYSYAVAIRMEQPQGGANAMNMSTDCATSNGTGIGGSASSNWYVIVQ